MFDSVFRYKLLILASFFLLAMRPHPTDYWHVEKPKQTDPHYIAAQFGKLRYKKTGDVCVAMTREQLFEIGHGVCRDFSYVSAVWLEEMGYNPWILIFESGPTVAHAVTVFEMGKGQWYAFNNTHLQYIGEADDKQYVVDVLAPGKLHEWRRDHPRDMCVKW